MSGQLMSGCRGSGDACLRLSQTCGLTLLLTRVIQQLGWEFWCVKREVTSFRMTRKIFTSTTGRQNAWLRRFYGQQMGKVPRISWARVHGGAFGAFRFPLPSRTRCFNKQPRASVAYIVMQVYLCIHTCKWYCFSLRIYWRLISALLWIQKSDDI